jgi:uncharacterized coiled-coil DUF342 family protein
MNHYEMEATIAELRAQLAPFQQAIANATDYSDADGLIKAFIAEQERLNDALAAMTEDRDVWATVAREMTEQRDVWQEVAGDMRRDANRLRAERNILLAALSPMPDAVRQKLDAIAEPK